MLVMVVTCLSLSVLILLHQYVLFGIWFEVADLHHETFAVAAFCLGLGLWLGRTGKETSSS